MKHLKHGRDRVFKLKHEKVCVKQNGIFQHIVPLKPELVMSILAYDPFGTETTYFWMLFLWQMGHKLPWETPKYLPVLLAAGFTTPYPCISFVPKHPTSICRLAVVGSNKFPPSALGSCNTGEGGYGKDKISFSGKCKYLWWTTWSRPSIKKKKKSRQDSI